MRPMNTAVSAVLSLAALGLLVGRGEANHVQVGPQSAVVYAQPAAPPTPPVTVSPTPAPPTVTVVPAPSTVVISAPNPSITVPAQPALRVDQIRAHVVRASTIYANRIEADQITGAIHHSDSVAVNATVRGEVVNPDVAASIIYADAIAANQVAADQVYVRDLEMRPAHFVIAPLGSRVAVGRQSP